MSSFSTPGSSVTTTTSFPLSITSTSGSRSSLTSGPRAPGSTFPNSRMTGFPSGPTDMEKPYTNGEAPSCAFGISTAFRIISSISRSIRSISSNTSNHQPERLRRLRTSLRGAKSLHRQNPDDRPRLYWRSHSARLRSSAWPDH